MDIKFVNREREMKTLNNEYSSENSSFVVIYGRRRTGKTTLIKEFIKNKNAIFFLGDTQIEYNQINSFKTALSEYYEDSFIKNINIESWDKMFEYFKSKIENNTILVIDEFQYLVKSNKAFPSIFNKFWESLFQEKKIMVIICGSLMGMMHETALSYKSPLYGRRTAQINLKPIDFSYFNQFYKEDISMEDIVRNYAVTGGIPKYIEQLKNYGNNVLQGIEEKILDKDSILYSEAKFILQEEVTDTSTYFTILKIISEGDNKIGNIAAKMNLNTNHLSPFLSKLIELDILEKEIPVTEEYPEKSRKGLYFIKDNFMNFWFRFIFPRMGHIESGNEEYVMTYVKDNFEQYVSTIYENICRKMMYRLQLPIEINKYGRWWDKNCEIDILGIGEKDIIVGECKWSVKQVGISVLENLKNKTRELNINSKEISYILFSKSGFSEELTKLAEEKDKIWLIDVDDFKKFIVR